METLKRPDLRRYFGAMSDFHSPDYFKSDFDRLNNEHYFGAIDANDFYKNVASARIDSAVDFAYTLERIVKQALSIDDPVLEKLIKPALAWCAVDGGFEEKHYLKVPSYSDGLDMPVYAFDAMCAHYFIRMCADSAAIKLGYYDLEETIERYLNSEISDDYFDLYYGDTDDDSFNDDDVIACALLQIIEVLSQPILLNPQAVDFSKAYRMDLFKTIRNDPASLPKDYLHAVNDLDPSDFGRKNY